MEKSVTVIIPAYNEEPRKRCFNVGCGYSRAKQIVVADDGSDDNTFIVAKKYPVTVLRHDQNRKRCCVTNSTDYIDESPFWIYGCRSY